MPQVSIEYSSNVAQHLDARGLALAIHRELTPIIDTDPETWKTRLIELHDTIIGDGSPDNATIHVDLRILSGRSAEQTQQAGRTALALASEALSVPERLKLQLTVEVRDLDADNYHKKQSDAVGG